MNSFARHTISGITNTYVDYHTHQQTAQHCHIMSTCELIHFRQPNIAELSKDDLAYILLL